MLSRKYVETFFEEKIDRHIPHLSVDCVIFGFHGADLKVLLLKWKGFDRWALPGGYVERRESLDAAAQKVLLARTGLRRVHLRQFHAFGGLNRKEASVRKLFAGVGVKVPDDTWPLHRVVSIGYYALVDYWKVRPGHDFMSDSCMWCSADELPPLAFDHRDVIRVARETLRESLASPHIAATLLPERFTMPELQRLHEAILSRELDRRNFQKRMLESGMLERLPDRRTGGAHRAPYLYRFKVERAGLSD